MIHPSGRFKLVSLCSFFLFLSLLLPAQAGDVFKQDKPSSSARNAVKNFRYPDEFQLDIHASEPLVKNPVALTLDRKNRVYVAETYRWRRGIEDNRDHWYWLMDDLAAGTIQDRLKKFRKWAKKGKKPMSYYRQYAEKVRRLEDQDNDGQADHSRWFADGFDGPLAGTIAGLLFYRNALYVTSIPSLWKLRDTDEDGRADERNELFRGFGVRSALTGHDLHGLTLGPDGRIYFSVGDRGFNLKRSDGRLKPTIDEGRGAVFRCEPDGSNLELVHQGLRNPQDLTFDEHGNLFTVDNESDAKDKGRLVYVVEGGDSGWMGPFQYMDRWDLYNKRGPWLEEKLWKTHFKQQPDWIIPPLAHPLNGPSGLAYHPGSGFSKKYSDHFFLCDYHGSPKSSGIQTFTVSEDGASFQLEKNERFVDNVAATDVEFGYDGKLYFTDWVTGWRLTNKGRVHTIYNPDDRRKNDGAGEVQKLFRNGFQDCSTQELVELLSHPDRRVRLHAQLALVRKQSGAAVKALQSTALDEDKKLVTRLHGIWGVGVVARRRDRSVLQPLEPLLNDDHPEVRSQTMEVMGEANYGGATKKMKAHVTGSSLRTRYFAARALGELSASDALEPIVQMGRKHAPEHPYLRHAAVMFLKEMDGSDLLNYADHPSATVRKLIVLALRRKRHPALSRFLNDRNAGVVAEAARAIYDLSMKKQLPELAGLLDRASDLLNRAEAESGSSLHTDAVLRRSMNVNFRLREPEYVRNVASFVTKTDIPEDLRKEAIKLLENWSNPKPIDRVLGRYMEFQKVEKKRIRNELQSILPRMMTSTSGSVQTAVTELASAYDVEISDSFFKRILRDADRPGPARAAALRYLSNQGSLDGTDLLSGSLQSNAVRLRITARNLLAERKPKRAVQVLKQTIQNGTTREKQAALKTLASINRKSVDQLFVRWLKKLKQDGVPPEIRLDLIKAAENRSSDRVKKELEAYRTSREESDIPVKFRVALAGGDPNNGEMIFRNHSGAQCMRCHAIDGTGGHAGPDLSDVGSRRSPEYILESLIEPNAEIARGFKLVTVTLEDGTTVSGTVEAETDQTLRVVNPAGNVRTLNKERITERSENSTSSMPAMDNVLTRSQIRDLVAFLKQQTE